jgi:hypothetical protein
MTNFVTVPFQCGDCGHIYEMAIDADIDDDLFKSTFTMTCTVCKNQNTNVSLKSVRRWIEKNAVHNT